VTGFGSTLSTFPSFLAYFVLGGGLTALFVLLYANLTPQRDIALIRGGNSAAAIALVGGLLGFVVPLASVIAHSAGIIDPRRVGHRRAGPGSLHRGRIYQAAAPLPVFGGMHALIGSWIIAGRAAGIGLREDRASVTTNMSRFVPHYFR
jgi:hypothetical protein